MKTRVTMILIALIIALGGSAAYAQRSLPAPGSGGNSAPAPGTGSVFNPGPPSGGGWGSPWNSPGWNTWNAPMIVNQPMSSPNWQNAGTMNVIGVGYDVQGVWRTIPMTVSYQYNGVQYNVTVVNAWNPWSDSWDTGIYDQAFNTTYWLRGTTYNFYTVLSTGTYYFNL